MASTKHSSLLRRRIPRPKRARRCLYIRRKAHALSLVECVLRFRHTAGAAPYLPHRAQCRALCPKSFGSQKTGAHIECNLSHKKSTAQTKMRRFLSRRLCGAGYEDRILPGLDATRKRWKSYGGSTGPGSILGAFLPLPAQKRIFTEIVIHVLSRKSRGVTRAYKGSILGGI